MTPEPKPTDDTGLPGLRSWRAVYAFVLATFALWVVLLILLTTIIMPLCVLCSWRYIQARVKEFMICLLIMESAMVGVFCALDLVLFFVFWEAMLIPMALLIGIWGGPRKIYAALKFFVYTMAGSVFLLVAFIALYLKVGTFSIPELMGQSFSSEFQFWIFLAFMGALIVGSLIADRLGKLPTAEELQAEDQAQYRKFERES